MREVTAVGQVEAHDPVVGVEQRGVHGEVGWGPGERLDVDAPLVILEPERLERALLAQPLRLVDELVTAVVALAGEALGVLVGEARPVHVHHRLRREVLRRDEFEAEALALLLLLHDGGHLCVCVGSGYVRRVSDAARRISEADLDGAEGGWEGEKKRGSAPCWRRIHNSCEKAIGRRCCAGYSGGIARFSPPGRAPRRRDPGKGPSWSRWGARRPREGARGLRENSNC